MPKTNKTLDFEQSLEKLNNLAIELEQGNLSLEDSLKQFEAGVKLIRSCQEALKQAEQKVQLLTSTQTDGELSDFNNDD